MSVCVSSLRRHFLRKTDIEKTETCVFVRMVNYLTAVTRDQATCPEEHLLHKTPKMTFAPAVDTSITIKNKSSRAEDNKHTIPEQLLCFRFHDVTLLTHTNLPTNIYLQF